MSTTSKGISTSIPLGSHPSGVALSPDGKYLVIIEYQWKLHTAGLQWRHHNQPGFERQADLQHRRTGAGRRFCADRK